MTTEKPAVEVLTGFWLHLKPHAENNSVFIVTQDLDLQEVALLAAKDDAEAISAWIRDGQIARPTLEQLEAWDESAAKSFRFAIVQPYVLIQEQGH
jgi:hypothetical protein